METFYRELACHKPKFRGRHDTIKSQQKVRVTCLHPLPLSIPSFIFPVDLMLFAMALPCISPSSRTLFYIMYCVRRVH